MSACGSLVLECFATDFALEAVLQFVGLFQVSVSASFDGENLVTFRTGKTYMWCFILLGMFCFCLYVFFSGFVIIKFMVQLS